MSYQREREGFIAAMSREGASVNTARTILREANSVQRLAVDECNGVPEDTGRVRHCYLSSARADGKDVTPCGDEPSRIKDARRERVRVNCPNCRSTFHEERITNALNGSGIVPEFHGDPRGYTVKLKVNGREIGVPTRSY